jgi:outer membrane protein TolC
LRSSVKEASELARLRFDNGVADSLAVLDTERTLINALDKIAQAEKGMTAGGCQEGNRSKICQ